MKSSYLFVVAAVFGVLLTVVPRGTAQGTGPKVVDRNSVAFGRTYSEWSAAWEQWADSIPVANHPLFDNGDCSVGQSGPVWFLGGKFCPNSNPNCGTANVVRSCAMPAGKALYIPVLNSEDSVLEEQTLKQIQELRLFDQSSIDSATNLSFEVDGAAIPHLKDRFRVQSPAFVFTLPDDNLFKAIYPGNYVFPAGAYFPAVDDGVYVMLSPLPAGSHVIHFHGALPVFNFVLDVTYHVTVAK